jgi:LuxR family transcriptional regulator, maltose regulon positive regulatory protein
VCVVLDTPLIKYGQALQHFRLARALPEVHRLAHVMVVAAMDRDEYAWARRLVESFQQEEVSLELELRLAQTLIRTGDLTQAEEILHKLQPLCTKNAFWHAIMANINIQRGMYEQGLYFCDKGLLLNPEPRIRAFLLMAQSSTYGELGMPNESIKACEEAVYWAEITGERLVIISILSSLAATYGEVGRKIDCEKTFVKVLEQCEHLGVPNKALMNYNNFASFLIDWGRFPEAFQLSEIGLKTALKLKDTVWLPLLYTSRGLANYKLGMLVNAISDFETAIPLCKKFNLDAFAYRNYLWITHAWLFLENLGAAKSNLETAKRLQPDKAPAEINRLLFAEGLTDFFDGLYSEAEAKMQRIGDVFDTFDQPRVLAYLAEIARREGKFTRAMAAGIKAKTDELGHTQSLRMDAHILHGLYAECVRRRWFPELFAPLLEPLQIPVVAPAQPRLQIQTLGALRVTLDGEAVKIPLSKASELLVWLALHGAASRDELVQALFGDAKDEKAVHYFKLTVRKLRAALMQHASVHFDPIPYAQGSYSLHADLRTDLDALALLEFAIDGSSDAASLLEVFESYRGDFLPKFKADWINDQREALREKAALVALEYAARLELTDPDKAISVYNTAMKWNRLEERAYVRLSALLESRADVVGAKKVLKSWQSVLTT